MSDSNRAEPTFRGGTGGADCEDFITAVNQWAFEEEKQDNDRLVAQFAYSRIAGEVLRFYDTLDTATQESWKLLRQALLARYLLEGPTMPWAPPAGLSSRNNLCAGVIRVEVEGDTATRYLVHTIDGSHDTYGRVVDKDVAMVFKLRRSSELQPIRFSNSATWLALRWYKAEGRRTESINEAWAYITCIKETKATGCCENSASGPASWMVWKYRPTTGAVEACWPEDNGCFVAETNPQIGFDPSDGEVRLFRDVDAFRKNRAGSRWTTAKLVFVPL